MSAVLLGLRLVLSQQPQDRLTNHRRDDEHHAHDQGDVRLPNLQNPRVIGRRRQPQAQQNRHQRSQVAFSFTILPRRTDRLLVGTGALPG